MNPNIERTQLTKSKVSLWYKQARINFSFLHPIVKPVKQHHCDYYKLKTLAIKKNVILYNLDNIRINKA